MNSFDFAASRRQVPEFRRTAREVLLTLIDMSRNLGSEQMTLRFYNGGKAAASAVVAAEPIPRYHLIGRIIGPRTARQQQQRRGEGGTGVERA